MSVRKPLNIRFSKFNLMCNIIFYRKHIILFSIIFVIRVVIPKTTIVFCKDMHVRDKYSKTVSTVTP